MRRILNSLLCVSKYDGTLSLVFYILQNRRSFCFEIKAKSKRHEVCRQICFYWSVSTSIFLLNQLNCVSCQALNGMPKSPDLPVFCKFNYFVMFECVCAIAVSCLLISFYHMNVNIELPDWVKVRGIFSLLSHSFITGTMVFVLTRRYTFFHSFTFSQTQLQPPTYSHDLPSEISLFAWLCVHFSLLFSQTHILDRMAWLVFLRSSVNHRLKTAEKFRKQGINLAHQLKPKNYFF